VMTRHLKKLEKQLYQDMLKHMKQTDQVCIMHMDRGRRLGRD
jgi:hypothetical protein